MKNPTTGISIFALAGLLFSTSCSRKHSTSAPPAAPVLVGKAESRTTPVSVKTIGNVEAYLKVTIKSQVNGQVSEAHVRAGQDVKKGDLLFTIDPRPFEAALKAAEANAAKAASALERRRQLVGSHAISEQDLEQAQADSQVAAAARDQAKLDLEYCSIRSLIDGRAGDVMVDVGNLVKANDVPVLLTINQINPIYVNFALPEAYLTQVRKYMAEGSLKVQARIPREDAPEDGVLSFIDNAVDANTGTIRMKATFENQHRRLWPGQFVDVTLILTEEPNVTVVPTAAIQKGQAGQYVFVVKEDHSAEMRPVVVGRSVDDQTVIEKGVQPGETVVTDGQLRIVPGGKVEIKKGLQSS